MHSCHPAYPRPRGEPAAPPRKHLAMQIATALLLILGTFAAASILGLLVNEFSGTRAPTRDILLRVVALMVICALAIGLYIWGGGNWNSIAVGATGLAAVIVLGLVVAKPHRLA